jgi:hypothetical protein
MRKFLEYCGRKFSIFYPSNNRVDGKFWPLFRDVWSINSFGEFTLSQEWQRILSLSSSLPQWSYSGLCNTWTNNGWAWLVISKFLVFCSRSSFHKSGARIGSFFIRAPLFRKSSFANTIQDNQLVAFAGKQSYAISWFYWNLFNGGIEWIITLRVGV